MMELSNRHERVGGTLMLSLATYLALTSGCGSSDAVSPALRIVTWNVHNLYDTTSSGAESKLARDEYRARISDVAGVLMDLDADIALFQEVDTPAVLEDLAFALPNSDYLTYYARGNDLRGMQIGVLSRVPARTVVSHRDDVFGSSGMPSASLDTISYRYARDCLEIEFELPGDSLVMLGVHFKSKADPDEPERRLAEARHTRRIADGILLSAPFAKIVVAGDVNDVPSSRPYEALVGQGKTAFTSAATAIPNAWTYDHAGDYELIDHQIVSPGLAASLDGRAVTIDHGSTARRASDHAPLAAAYWLR